MILASTPLTVLLSIIGLLITPSAAQLQPSNALITFFWSDNSTTEAPPLVIPQCIPYEIQLFANPGSNAPPVPPYHFLAAPVGGLPEVQLVAQSLGGSFRWIPNFAVGTMFTLSMTDSANNSGGSVGPYTMTSSANKTCPLPSNITSIVASYDPPNNACGEIDVSITGGRAPYTVSVIAPKLGKYSNLTTSTNPIKLANIISSGETFFLFVTDSTGNSSIVSSGMTSGLGQSGCTPIGTSNPPSSSRSLGAIIGGVVGGVVGAIILLLLAYFFYRRRKAAHTRLQHQIELNNSNNPEYRMADGSAPLVTPFVLPPQRQPSQSQHLPAHPIETQNLSHQNSYSNVSPNDTKSNYTSSQTNPSSPHLSQHFQPSPPLPQLPTSSSSYTSPSPAGTYQSTVPTLANPDGFEYRDSRTFNPGYQRYG